MFVSERLWAEIMGLPLEDQSDNWPKVNISAIASEEFCRRRSARDGIPWRLPTKEEWAEDYAANPHIHIVFGWTSSVVPISGLRVVCSGNRVSCRPTRDKFTHLWIDPTLGRNACGLRCYQGNP